MYKLSVCVALFFFVPSILGMSEEMQELIDMLHKTCVDESGADDALVKRAQKGDFELGDEKLRCYAKCIMTEMSTIDDAGVVDIEAALAVLPEDVKPKLEPVMRKCNPAAGGDGCENALLYFKCLAEGAPNDFFFP